MRWVLLSEVIEVIPGKRALAKGEVPGAPYSPEVLMIEMMAQTGALLIGAVNDFTKDLVFAKVEKAEFKHPLSPGEGIEIEARCENVHDDGAWVETSIRSSSEEIASARCLLMNIDHLVEGSAKPVTFHKNFMNYFDIQNKVKK